MVTHRGRNKLERKAHMNIHDTIEVVDGAPLPKGVNYTRDRFGKKHEIKKPEKK
jgi:hypothetical protein